MIFIMHIPPKISRIIASLTPVKKKPADFAGKDGLDHIKTYTILAASGSEVFAMDDMIVLLQERRASGFTRGGLSNIPQGNYEIRFHARLLH